MTAIVLTGITSTAYAHEGPELGIEVGPNFVLNDGLDESVGIGVNGRIGYHLHSGSVFLTPEVKLGFESPGTPNAFRILGGLRMGLLSDTTPVAFAHVGGTVGDLDGLAWDVGGGLQINFDAVALGATVAYNRVEGQDLIPAVGRRAFEWIQVAGSVALVL